LREYMIQAMKFWVTDIGIDGFRCDAVSYVPKDFWQEALTELKAIRPDLFFLAEDDGSEWHPIGFDMTYGWGLYGFSGGILKRIADGTNNANNLSSYATSERNRYPAEAYRMYFTSNHDENSWQGTPTELFGAAAEPFAVLTATFHGIPLVYSGQEAGFNKRLSFFDKDQIVWRSHANAELYTTLLHLKRTNQALWNGDKGSPLQRVQTSNNAAIFAFVREKDEDRVFAAFNLSAQEQQVTLEGTSFIGNYRNVFTDEPFVLEANATLTLPSWDYLVGEAIEVNSIIPDEAAPAGFELRQNYPNPFNSVTKIPYTLAIPSKIRLTIFDVLGREVQSLASGLQSAGTYEIAFDAVDLPSGIYLYHFQAGSYMAMKRLLLLR